jgi:dethiobiotin synthetase
MRYFITGIGTDVGKTHISAALTAHLKAHYWKPIQAGLPRDADFLRQLEPSIPDAHILPSKYELALPASPHYAASQEGVSISLDHIELPAIDGPLIIEGAGGLLVPINDSHTIADIANKLGLPLIVCISFYLGSINHTLLTLEVARLHKLPIAGLAYFGQQNAASRQAIEQRNPYPILVEYLQGKPPIFHSDLLNTV